MKKILGLFLIGLTLGLTQAEAREGWGHQDHGRGFHDRGRDFTFFRRPCGGRIIHDRYRYYEPMRRYRRSGWIENDPFFSFGFDSDGRTSFYVEDEF